MKMTFLLLNLFINAYAIDKVVILDTGINLEYINKNKLCKVGHRSFTSTSWDVDELNHGTNVFNLASQGVDSTKICYVIVKWTNVRFDTKTLENELDYVKDLRPIAVNIALSGQLKDENEHKILKSIVNAGIHVFVAAGNEYVNLDYSKRYPAGFNLNRKYWHVVGVKDSKYSNYGSIVTDFEDGRIGSQYGTSFAAPRVLNKFVLSH